MTHTLNAAQCATLSKCLRLRAQVFKIDADLGVWFARELSRECKAHGVPEGIRAACWSLQQIVAEVVGGWDVHAAARALTVSL